VWGRDDGNAALTRRASAGSQGRKRSIRFASFSISSKPLSGTAPLSGRAVADLGGDSPAVAESPDGDMIRCPAHHRYLLVAMAKKGHSPVTTERRFAVVT